MSDLKLTCGDCYFAKRGGLHGCPKHVTPEQKREDLQRIADLPSIEDSPFFKLIPKREGR